MVDNSIKNPKIYVLDTSVLLFDHRCLFKFKKHNVVIPIPVLEELDDFKVGNETKNFEARGVIRDLDNLFSNKKSTEWCSLGKDRGYISIRSSEFNSDKNNKSSCDLFGKDSEDNKILDTARSLSTEYPESRVILVSKDINLRLKSKSLGIDSQDYQNGKLENLKAIKNANSTLIVDEYEAFNTLYSSKNSNCLADLVIEDTKSLINNSYYTLSDGNKGTILTKYKNNSNSFYRVEKRWAYNISPKNAEQTFAMDALLDPSIHLVAINGIAGSGKAQPLDEPVLTPTGWKPMGDLKPGDQVIGSNGKPTNVLSVHPQGKLDIYEVKFSDGSSTRCCGDHLWNVLPYLRRHKSNKNYNKYVTLNTNTLKENLRYISKGKNTYNYSIPTVRPVEFDNKEVDIDPYYLGVLLGDGCLRNQISLSCSDESIKEEVLRTMPKEDRLSSPQTKSDSNTVDYYISVQDPLIKTSSNRRDHYISVTKKFLNNEGLYGVLSDTKFIPEDYLYNSSEIRISLLQGLMDTDGTIESSGHGLSFSTTSVTLSEQVGFIVNSLGGTYSVNSRNTYYTYKGERKQGKTSYRLYIKLPPEIVPFRSCKFKLKRYKPLTKYKPMRFIESIDKVCNDECQCIKVEAEDSLYVTKDFIVTHNTLLAIAAALEQNNKYNNIMLARPIIPLSNRSIGFLPGEANDKISPYMQPLFDNIKFIKSQCKGENSKKVQRINEMQEKGELELTALAFIRGRSLNDTFIIIDEAQNLTPHEVKTIVTRAGTNTKIVFAGDVNQIDTPYMDEKSNGLSYLISKMKGQDLFSHIKLVKGERSELANLANKLL